MHKGVAQHKHIVNAHKAGQNDSPNGTDHTKVHFQDKHRDHTGTGHHSHEQQLQNDALALIIPLGKRISHQDLEDHGQQCAGNGIENGVAVTCPYDFILEYEFVALQAEVHRPQQDPGIGQRLTGGEGAGYDINHRIANDDKDQNEDDRCDKLQHAVAKAFADLCRFFCHDFTLLRTDCSHRRKAYR